MLDDIIYVDKRTGKPTEFIGLQLEIAIWCRLVVTVKEWVGIKLAEPPQLEKKVEEFQQINSKLSLFQSNDLKRPKDEKEGEVARKRFRSTETPLKPRVIMVEPAQVSNTDTNDFLDWFNDWFKNNGEEVALDNQNYISINEIDLTGNFEELSIPNLIFPGSPTLFSPANDHINSNSEEQTKKTIKINADSSKMENGEILSNIKFKRT